jgi:hypothetical protein
MKARQLLEEHVHRPKTRRVVFEAFDLAWAQREPDYPVASPQRASARHRLAAMMLSFVTEDTRDAKRLKEVTLSALKPPQA